MSDTAGPGASTRAMELRATKAAQPAGCRRSAISIDTVLALKTRNPEATTRGRGWAGVTLDLYAPLQNCSAVYPALDHHLVSYCPSGSSVLTQHRDGRGHSSTIVAGTSIIMPAGLESRWEGDTAISARLRIPVALVRSAGEQLGPRSHAHVAIRNVFEVRDGFFQNAASLLLGEIERQAHPAQALIVDQVSAALAAHLVRSYGEARLFERSTPCALSQARIARIRAFVEENLDTPIRLDALATIAELSRFHFSRSFKKATGMTVMRFVEQSRIRRAQSLILETDIPLAEIGLMTGFADQSHFTKRFHHHVGCPPAMYAREHGRRPGSARST